MRTTVRLTDRCAILAGNDQRTQQVNSAFEVVLLGVQVDADEVRVEFGLRHRQGCCYPCQGCSSRALVSSLRTDRRKLLARWTSSSSRGPTGQEEAICFTWASRPGAGTSSFVPATKSFKWPATGPW